MFEHSPNENFFKFGKICPYRVNLELDSLPAIDSRKNSDALLVTPTATGGSRITTEAKSSFECHG